MSVTDTENPRTPVRHSETSECEDLCSPTVSADSVDGEEGPRRSSAPSQLSLTSCPVDKLLPSEKPLPSTPEAESDGVASPVQSRTLLDAREVPLRWSPPGNPDVQQEWPILSPLKAGASKNAEKRESDIKLVPITEEGDFAASPDEVEVFKDAVSELPETSHDMGDVNQACAEKASNIGYENKGPGAVVLTGCHTPSSEDTCLAIGSPSTAYISPRSAGFPSSDLPMSSSPEKDTTSATDIIDDPSKMPGSNPFRDRLRASASSNTTKKVSVDKKAFNSTFDTMTEVATAAAETVTEGAKDKRVSERRLLEPNGQGKSTPAHRQSVTKIPRFSPTTSQSNHDDHGGETPKLRKFSPGGRSAIPVPSRLLYKHKTEDDATGGRHDAQNTYTPVGKAASRNSAPLESEKPAAAAVNGKQSPKSNDTGSGDRSLHHSIELGNKVTVREISTATPGHGPTLRISPDAERVIMGKDERGPAVVSKEKSKGLVQSGSIRELRLSTETLFNNFSQRCGKSSLSRSSFSGRLEPEPSPLAGKSVYKAKSADLGSRRPSRYRGRAKETPEKSTTGTVSRSTKFGTNPFFSNNESTLDSPSSGRSTATVFKAGSHAHPEPEEASNPTRFESGSGQPSMKQDCAILNGNAAPSNVDGSNNDRSTVRKINGTPNKESPRSTRAHRPTATAQSSPRKNFGSPSPGQGTPSRPITTRVNAGRNGHAIISPVPKERAALTQRKRERRPESGPAATRSEVKIKGPTTTRGVFSNFRGLFTKHRVDPTKETSGIPQPKHKSVSKLKTSSHATLAGSDNQGASNSASGHDAITGLVSAASQSPALSDTGTISRVAMDILDFARREADTSRKERLIKVS